jgi:uncharacterized protein (DUF433 family)/DNA-binding transcriptional MerR regulator
MLDFRPRGAYSTGRAAALAGVPMSTVYYWARQRVYEPSISRTRVILWSWPDLLALRAIYWLRQGKLNIALERTTMSQVRGMLETLEALGDRLGDHLADRSVVLRVDTRGRPHLGIEDKLLYPLRGGVAQFVSPGTVIDLLREYQPGGSLLGPHLLEPRPRVRIIPGKLGGEPHVRDTRVETLAIDALAQHGYTIPNILQLYPFLDSPSVEDSLDLERQLQRNLRVAA